uniref:CoA transferase n=2 Tax=Streptomyces TaxID=1883 RepID=UPI0006E328B3
MSGMDKFSEAGKPPSARGFAAGDTARAGKFEVEFEPGPEAVGGSGTAGSAGAVTGRTGRRPSATAQAWAALGGDPALLGRVTREQRGGLLPSALPVRELASATVAACSLAAAEFSCVRARSALLPPVRVDDGAVATAFHSDRLVRIDGRAPVTFAPLSRFWRTADGWVRTHANYPHHRARLLSALGMPDHGPAEDEAAAGRVATELAGRQARDVEEAVHAEGGLAVAVRTVEEWTRHPQRAAVAQLPLVELSRLDAAPTPALDGPTGPGGLRGVRILDLTRVLAGPVATRTLALLGADVLRIDAPERPELLDTHADTDLGKRSTLLDLSSRPGQAAFEELLSMAHVVVTGYRPGALDRFGLAPESLMDRRPGLVVGQLSAWGAAGPWQRRRGFDSLVQAATGIACLEAADGAGGASS